MFYELENLLNFSNLYGLYNSILANIRVFLYIELLRQKKMSPQKIGNVLQLGKRQFLLQKNYRASFQDIQKLYTQLLSFDKHMKSGKLVSSQESDIYQALKRVFIEFLA